MRRMPAILAVSFCGLLPVGAAFAQALLAPSDLHALGYETYWTSSIEQRRGATVKSTYLRDDTLYVITDDGTAHAVHALAGLSRWSQNLVSGVYEIFPPTHFIDHRDRPLVVFTTTPRTVLIDRYSGDIIVEIPTPHAPAGSAIGSEDLLLFGSSDGHFYAEYWDQPALGRAVQYWRVRTDGEIRATPALINESNDLIFASQTGTVYCCTKLGKLLNWKYRTEGDLLADITVDESGVYVAGGDRSLYRLGLGGGEPKWRVRFPEPLHDRPVVAGKTVYQYCIGEGLVALDADTGNLAWRNTDAREVIAVGVDTIFARALDARVLKLDARSGDIVATAVLPPETSAVVNTQNDSLYLVNRRGGMMCARPAGSGHLTPGEMAQARLDLHKPPTGPAATPAPSPTPQPLDEGVDLKDPLRSRSDRPEKEGEKTP